MSNVRQLNFSGGEISPSLWARVDLVKYATGLRTCKNFIVMRHGGVANRPGTGFVGEIKDSTKTARFIPFIFNSSQTYALEFGNLYMRVHRNGSQITETAKNITGATQANPCVITSNAHGFSNGQEVYISGVGGMTELNNRNFKVANVTANTFELQYMYGTAVNSTAFGAYTSGGTVARIYEITTPYVEADLPELQYVQSADVITLVHPNYAQRELSRTGHTSWALSPIVFAPALSAPTGVNVTGTAGSSYYYYKVTAIKDGTFEESLPSALATGSLLAAPSSSAAITVTWTAVTGAKEYNVYRSNNDIFGFIGVAGGTTFSDIGVTPDIANTPPEDQILFASTGNYPSAVTYYQQRLIFANSNNDPQTVWASRSALYKNFTKDWPIQSDGTVTFSMVGRQVNKICHMVDIGKLVMFTTGGEWTVNGDTNGILTPSNINPKQHTANGSGTLPPLVVGGNALYVQARGSVVRDLAYDFQVDGYRGNELSIFAAHLFDGYTIKDWAYQQIPHSIVWAVRNDGILLGLTYVREHQVFGWHRHEFDGLVENVCVVPEGTEDVLYLLIKRTINGRSVRYIERMKTRQITDIVDAVFLDCSLTYDGRNTNTGHTMTLSGGTNWTSEEDLTLTSSASFFVSTDPGNYINLTASDGSVLRCKIKSYTSGTVVTVNAQRTVPASLRGVTVSAWSKAVDGVSGLWHLEGKTVGIFADGFVSASPNNDAYIAKTISGGKVTLADPHAVIHVGLPITSDMETLNIDIPGLSSMADKKKNVNRLTLFVESSRGIWAGPDVDNLTELKMRNNENYDKPVALATGTEEIIIRSEWNSTGKVLIRQIDPLPVSILAVVPTGYIAAQ